MPKKNKLNISSWCSLDLLKKIGALADAALVEVYVVGGYVRDQILGKETQDIDFVVVGDGPCFTQKVKDELNGHGYVVYEKFGTASCIVDEHKLEFVTAREESYDNHSRNSRVAQSDLHSDLTRRDFTVNTLAMGIQKANWGKLIDPFNGLKDIKSRCIQTPLEPRQTFSDDPLRMMRAARFAGQLNFKIYPETFLAMEEEKERLQIVSQERITDELLKILSHAKPSIGLRILYDTGILRIIFPELTELAGVEQRTDYHHKDVFEHTLKVLDNLAGMSNNVILRFTALVHDIGKPKVKRFVEGKGWTFHGHDVVGTRMLKPICSRLKLSNAFCTYASKLTQLHMRPIQLINEDVTDSAIRRLIVHAGEDMDDLMTLCRADITSGNPKRVRQHLANFDLVAKKIVEVEEKDCMRAFQSPVRGEKIMEVCQITPGPLVGVLKKAVEEAILEGEIPNAYDAALQFLLDHKDQIIDDFKNR